MRRALVLAALAAPVAVIAAILAAPSGQVVDLDNYNAEATQSYVNAAQCADSAATPLLNLEWSIVRSVPVGSADYKLYASNVQSSKDDDANYCPVQDDTAVTPNEFARSLGTVAYATDLQRLKVSGSAAVAAAHKSCAVDGDILFVCAHLVDATTSANIGYARGKFMVQVAAPGAPPTAGTSPGEQSLTVTWTAPTGSPEAFVYRVVAKSVAAGCANPADPASTCARDPLDPDVHEAISGIRANEQEMRGLVNNVLYRVEVYSRSVGGNENPTPATTTGTPVPVDDFWEFYRKQPGAREAGGCGAGGAGPLALLGVAGLLGALRRRK